MLWLEVFAFSSGAGEAAAPSQRGAVQARRPFERALRSVGARDMDGVRLALDRAQCPARQRHDQLAKQVQRVKQVLVADDQCLVSLAGNGIGHNKHMPPRQDLWLIGGVDAWCGPIANDGRIREAPFARRCGDVLPAQGDAR
jgi:hypothetical protein